jgi:hypothetical protein
MESLSSRVPLWPLAALLAVPERGVVPIAWEPLFFMYSFFILFPWATGFELMSVVKQFENNLI